MFLYWSMHAVLDTAAGERAAVCRVASNVLRECAVPSHCAAPRSQERAATADAGHRLSCNAVSKVARMRLRGAVFPPPERLLLARAAVQLSHLAYSGHTARHKEGAGTAEPQQAAGKACLQSTSGMSMKEKPS